MMRCFQLKPVKICGKACLTKLVSGSMVSFKQILGDIETDMLFQEVCRNGGESKFLLPEFAISQCRISSQEQEGKVC
jgi:hypothetical protein